MVKYKEYFRNPEELLSKTTFKKCRIWHLVHKTIQFSSSSIQVYLNSTQSQQSVCGKGNESERKTRTIKTISIIKH